MAGRPKRRARLAAEALRNRQEVVHPPLRVTAHDRHPIAQGLILVAYLMCLLTYATFWVPMALARWCGTYLRDRYNLPQVTLLRVLDRSHEVT